MQPESNKTPSDQTEGVFIKEVTISDPEKNSVIFLEVWRDPVSGGAFGIDATYVDQVDDRIPNPFGNGGFIYLPERCVEQKPKRLPGYRVNLGVVDFDMLHRQKYLLLGLLPKSLEQDERDAIEGAVNLIEQIQDQAADFGYWQFPETSDLEGK